MFLDIFARLQGGDPPEAFRLVRHADEQYTLKLGNGTAFPACTLTGLSRGQLAGLRAEIDRALAEPPAEAAAV